MYKNYTMEYRKPTTPLPFLAPVAQEAFDMQPKTQSPSLNEAYPATPAPVGYHVQNHQN